MQDEFGFSMDTKETRGAVSRSVPEEKRVPLGSSDGRQAKSNKEAKQSGSKRENQSKTQELRSHDH